MLLYDIVQCAGMNADNYQGVFSEPVFITVELPETQKGMAKEQFCTRNYTSILVLS